MSIKVYYIDFEKNALLEDWVTKAGLEPIHFKAMDGTKHPNPESLVDIHFKDPMTGRNMTKGELGCALSHKKLWAEIANNNENAIILEGDAMCDNAFFFGQKVAEIDQILNETDYDFCYLGRQILEEDKPPGSIYEKMLVNMGYAIPTYNWLAHAYMLSPNGASVLLDGFDKIIPVDEWIPYKIGRNYHPQLLRYDFGGEFLEMEVENPETFMEELINQNSESILEAIAVANPNFVYQNRFRKSTTEKLDLIFKDDDPANDASKYLYAMATVATNPEHQGFRYLVRSAIDRGWEYSYNLGDDVEWDGGDMRNSTGGFKKVKLLAEWIEKENLDPEAVLIFLDGYDTLILENPHQVIQRWLDHFGQDTVVFAAEPTCWPDPSIAELFPKLRHGNHYLNSGCFIGKAKHIKHIIRDHEKLAANDDDQLFYQKEYLKNSSDNYAILLDDNCEIFQCISEQEERIDSTPERKFVYNFQTQTLPAIIHGNGGAESKVMYYRICTNIYPYEVGDKSIQFRNMQQMSNFKRAIA